MSCDAFSRVIEKTRFNRWFLRHLKQWKKNWKKKDKAYSRQYLYGAQTLKNIKILESLCIHRYIHNSCANYTNRWKIKWCTTLRHRLHEQFIENKTDAEYIMSKSCWALFCKQQQQHQRQQQQTICADSMNLLNTITSYTLYIYYMVYARRMDVGRGWIRYGSVFVHVCMCVVCAREKSAGG